MASIRCTVSMANDKRRKVEIEMIREKDGKLRWRELKSAGGNLHLYSSKGSWEISSGEILSLWYEPEGKERGKYSGLNSLITLIAFSIKQDFFDDIINRGSIVESEFASLYNHNPSEKEVLCKLARMN
jgi:hypothetical protein